MNIDFHTRQVTLGKKNCTYCSHNTTPGTAAKRKYRVCDKCKGTGRRGSGNCRACNNRGSYYAPGTLKPGYVTYWDHEDREPCPRCNGDYEYFDDESWTDNLPDGWANYMPIKVVILHQDQSWQEQNLGSGLYTIVDYGEMYNKLVDNDWAVTKPELIDKVRTKDLRRVQACKAVSRSLDGTLTLCDELAIIVQRTGYSVVPIFYNLTRAGY